MNRRLAVVVGLACAAGCAAVASATTVRKMETPELVSRSEVIVLGTVIAKEVVYDEGQSGPANVRTITTIEVTQTLKGQVGETVEVSGLGGRVGDYIYQWPGVPQFDIGEEALVMLSKPAPDQGQMKSLFAPMGRGNHMMVTGLEQGRLKIKRNDAGQKVVVESIEGLEFANGQKPAARAPRQLDNVIGELQDIIAAQHIANQRRTKEEGK